MNKKRILALSFLTILFFAPIIVLAVGGPFDYVPMEKIPGFEAESANGNFYTYIGTVYKFGLWTVGVCAMFMIGIGGYTYLISAGNSATMTKAKGYIFDAIAGLILALVSYLILYEINPNLVRLDGGTLGGGASTTSQSSTLPPSSTSGAPASGDEQLNRARLKDANINVNRTNACPPGQGNGCTSTAELRESTIAGLENLKQACPNCPMTLTGGSEGGHASTTNFTHANGYKADLGLSPTLDSYITTTYKASGTRSDGAKLYKDPSNNVYAKEGDHWDICYSCPT